MKLTVLLLTYFIEHSSCVGSKMAYISYSSLPLFRLAVASRLSNREGFHAHKHTHTYNS